MCKMALINQANHSFDLDIGIPLWCNQTHNHKKSQGHCSHISNLLGILPYPVNIHPHLQNSSEVFHINISIITYIYPLYKFNIS